MPKDVASAYTTNSLSLSRSAQMLQTQIKEEQSIRIKALEHLIDEDFDTEKSCHAVCHLLSQLFCHSDDEINQMVANLAAKALQSTVEIQTIN
jgi:hypothetical protein